MPDKTKKEKPSLPFTYIIYVLFSYFSLTPLAFSVIFGYTLLLFANSSTASTKASAFGNR